MVQLTEDLLDDIVETLVREVQPEKIVLFGSWASGLARPESDVDLLVVERAPFTPERSRRCELQRIRRSLAGYRIAKDILVYSADEVERWRESANHIIGQAFREGRVLYERS